MRGVVLAVLAAASIGLAACGSSGDGDSCPGRVCTNCGASGDCNIDCGPGEVEYCGHFGYFDDPNLRCAYCGPG